MNTYEVTTKLVVEAESEEEALFVYAVETPNLVPEVTHMKPKPFYFENTDPNDSQRTGWYLKIGDEPLPVGPFETEALAAAAKEVQA